MKIYLKAVMVTALVGLVFIALFWVWSRSTAPSATQKIQMIEDMETKGVSNFSMKDLAGKEIQLIDFKGSVTIISFWASWCGPCLEEFPSMIELVEKMDGKVKLLAISQDSDRSEIEAFLKAFPKSQNQNIAILWDESRQVGQQFGVERLPESFVLGKDQKLVRKVVGSIDWATTDAIQFMSTLSGKSQ